MLFQRKKKNKERILNPFGKLKEDSFDFNLIEKYFGEIVADDDVDFDFKLKPGKLKTRNAIRILQINDYSEKVIDEVNAISKELDKNTVAIKQKNKDK